MVRHLAAVVAAFALLSSAVPAGAAAPAPADAGKKPDRLADLLAKLRKPAAFKGDPKDVALGDLLDVLSKQHDVAFVVNEAAFRNAGVENVREAKTVVVATRLDGLSLGRFVDMVARSVGAVALVRRDYVELVHPAAVREMIVESAQDETAPPFTLVSAVYKETPLADALADLADEYDTTVVISPQAGDARNAFVSARLLNVPLDKALDLLAVQADLRVVKRGNAYLVTSADYVGLVHETELDRERHKAELERIKAGEPAGVPPVAAPAAAEKTAKDAARALRTPVSVECNATPFAEAVKKVVGDTGASVVLDPRLAGKADAPVTLKHDDLPLEAAVRLLAEVADLRAVRVSGVLFVTTAERADKLRAGGEGK